MKRIEELAALLKGSVVADIGTDHGLLVELALENPGVTQVIATDISQKSLEKCVERMETNPKRSRVTYKVCDGLKGIDTESVDEIVIAGMGGHRILSIIKEALRETKILRRLILSPQKGEEEVRRFLHSNGFRLETDLWVEENGHYYTILVAVPGNERYSTREEYQYGRDALRDGSPVLEKKLAQECSVLETVLTKLPRNAESRHSVQKRYEEIKEVQNALHNCRSGAGAG